MTRDFGELSVSPASASEDGGAQQIEVTAALAGADVPRRR